ncbi:MAG: DUF262 domain-containing protein [Thermoleophilia bacterium]
MPDMVFSNVGHTAGALVDRIESGQIGLPDIQRPFVWEAAKVRDLFDSMYRGFPVGHLLLWSSGAELGAKQIGSNAKGEAPQLLIVDGQQRLTSLYAVMRGRPVVGKDYVERRIHIAFRPKDGTFAVADAAVVRDPAFIPDISAIWTGSSYGLITSFLARLSSLGTLTEADADAIPKALQRLENLTSYPFTALVLGVDVLEEEVAEVFVRINSKGKNLNQADFILTLMSVFWDDGRAALELWSRQCRQPGDPAFNSFMSPDPDQLLRVAIALGFHRGRLESAYAVLRGRDSETGRITPEARQAQFARLGDAQRKVLDKETWNEFLQSLVRAGHRSASTISSTNALLFAYALYLIGKHEYAVPLKPLRDVIARWFFMSSLTGRYTTSPETQLEADLASLPTLKHAEPFIEHLNAIVDQRLTTDYWNITLPSELATSASRSPSLFAYLAALCILDAPVLFSRMHCVELMNPLLNGSRPKLQRHHLFPKKYLEQLGIVDGKLVSQIANMALLEWHDNIEISAKDPAEYWPAYLSELREPSWGAAPFTDAEIARMLHLHALDEAWPALEYQEFLDRRRRGIAQIIREGFERLTQAAGEPPTNGWPPSPEAIEHLLANGETNDVEFKSSLRADTAEHGVPPKVLEKVVARTVAGFMNQGGGVLIIGADDAGAPLGLDADLATLPRKDLDGFQQALVQVLAKHLGGDVAACTKVHLGAAGPTERPIAILKCGAHSGPVFLRDGDQTEFHVRVGNTTRRLDIAEATAYIAKRWNGLQSAPIADMTPE